MPTNRSYIIYNLSPETSPIHNPSTKAQHNSNTVVILLPSLYTKQNNMNITAAGMNLDMYHSIIFSGGDYWGFDRSMSKSESDDQVQGVDGGIDEDDLLYAELSRQVLLLTADDDEEVGQEQDCFLMEKFGGGGSYVNGGGNGNLMMMNSANGIANLGLGCGNQYFNWPAAAAGNSWGNSVNTGTGVFIPYVANSKRRNRRGKKNGKNRGSKVATESKQQW
ncbi:hypothetical protein LINPERPRIM_LOCUS16101 [Linum perenne]